MQPAAARFFEHATAHHRAGRLAEAERDYLEILRIEAGNADALRLLGALYVATNRLDRAVACLKQAHFVQPENAETLNNLAVALRNLGQLEDAIACYEEALKIDPHYVQALDNLGSAYFERGKPDEAIILHRQALRFQPDYPCAHYNLANALRDQKKFDEAIAHYQHALRLNPDYADALVNLGITLARLERFDEAGVKFEQALRLNPHNFRALNNLGGVRREQGRPEEACALYREALRLKSDYVEAHINFGNALRDLGRRDGAAQSYAEALRLKPDSTDALNNRGLLLCNAGRLDEAVACYDQALGTKPDSAEAKWNKALALLALGQYREGWELYESGLASGKRGVVPFHARRWDGREFPDRRLLIWGEQGLGDNLQFVRYAALCKQRGGTVIVLASKPLARLLANCPSIDEVVIEARDDDFDYQVAMMSLPHILNTTLDTIPASAPYLYVDDATRLRWAPKFAGVEGFKVGLVWAGNSRERQIDAHLIDRRRSLNLSQLQPLLDLEPIRFYNLQAGEHAAQINALGWRSRMTDYMPEAEDLLDTAAIIEHLDLVVAVDTSVAHLAGALGKPVWVLSRYDACWRWLRNRGLNPWYPTARVFGQPQPGDWDSVIENVRVALTQTA